MSHTADDSERRYRTIVSNAPVAFFLTNAEGVFTLSDGRGLAGSGLKPGEVVGRSALELFHDLPVQEASGRMTTAGDVLRRVLAGEEVRGITRLGDAVYDNSFLPMRDANGVVEGLMGVAVDVTASWKATIALAEREEEFRLVVENVSDVITVLSPDGRIQYESPSVTMVLGYAPGEMIGRSVFDFLDPRDTPAVKEAFTLFSGDPGRLEFRFRHRDGTYRLLEGVGRGLHSTASGRVAVVTSRDITERRRTEEALRSSEQMLRSIVTGAPIIVFAIDADGIFTLSEGHGLEVLGLSAGKALGRSVFDVYRDAPDVLGFARRALAGETVTGEARIGGHIYQTWYSPLRDGAGSQTGVVGVAIDVTERAELENQLRQSQKMEAVGRLAGGIAHDFNNLLTAILGYADLAGDDEACTPAIREDIEQIRKAATSAAMLTKQLLAFSRRQVMQPVVLSLNQAVNAIGAILRRVLGEDIVLTTDLDPAVPNVFADPTQVEQILMNLAVNARDAMPSGGCLTIETAPIALDAAFVSTRPGSRAGLHAVLRVSDNGVGMEESVRARVFEPFFTTKPAGKGTGLGLAMVYGAVKQMGGFVWVSSEVGHGTTFEIFLPATSGECSSEGPAAPPTAEVSGTASILIVDDQEEVRAVMETVLSRHGYRVTTATAPREALEVVASARESFDLLITDVVMPEMSGRELARAVTALDPSLRVLYMSGYTGDAIASHGILEPGLAFLPKPFMPKTLLTAVRTVLDAPQRPGKRSRRVP